LHIDETVNIIVSHIFDPEPTKILTFEVGTLIKNEKPRDNWREGSLWGDLYRILTLGEILGLTHGKHI
jgi:hypothetical protein